VLSIELPRLLGERHPTAARTRRAIRNKLLERQSLAATDHKAIRHRVDELLSEATALRDNFRENRKDEQTRRRCLALISEAVYLASDDEGQHALWLKEKCMNLTGITKDTALLPLALKAYGPYDYNDDARRHRIADKQVSRDYKAIVRVLSPDVLPPDLVNAWNQPSCGINASSRPNETAGEKRDSRRSKRIPLTVNETMYEIIIRQPNGKMLWLVEKTGRKFKVERAVADPNIVKAAVSQIKHQVAEQRRRRAP
jgi:hypothetical protein